MRLFFLVEGRSEELFVSHVLGPHLDNFGISSCPIVVETGQDPSGHKERGGGKWPSWKRHLQRILGENRGNDVRVTTMFDLYGLPDNFPEYAMHRAEMNTVRRAENLEAAMKNDIGGDWRLVPYLQRHEFEALVLAALAPLSELLDSEDRTGSERLIANLAGSSPEDVNDGVTTSPSHRLRNEIPGYQKTLYGPLALEAAGLSALREACPRFSKWIAQLEGLGQGKQVP